MGDKIPAIMAADFSDWFRRTRRMLDVTQKQFAAAWGRKQSAVSDIERGDRIEYNANDVEEIVNALLSCVPQQAETAGQIERDAYLAAGLLPPSNRRRPVGDKRGASGISGAGSPDATDADRERLRNEALAASVGLEVERSIDMEYAGGRYDGELSAIREIEQFPDLEELRKENMASLLRQAQRRMAIGGTGEAKKTEPEGEGK